MAAKLQIQFQQGKDTTPREIADFLSTLVKSKADQILPAYKCDHEKLVIIVYGKMDKVVREYVETIDAEKTENIVYITTTGDNLDRLTGISKGLGVNVAGTFVVPMKKTLFGKKLTTESRDKTIDFVKNIVNGLFEKLKL